MKPIVGIAGYQYYKEHNSDYFYDLEISPKGVTDHLRKAGALPIIIPLSKPEDAKSYVDKIDALVIPGGDDVSPIYYGEEPLSKLGKNSPKRDLFDLALIKEAHKQQKPILGICRGLQIINVAFGGSLYQDLSYKASVNVQHEQKTDLKYETHSVMIEKDSFLSNIYVSKLMVNSYHHQAIKRIAPNFKVTAKSTDGIIEAIEHTDQKIYAVQWHPELMAKHNSEHQKVFDAFVKSIE